jgi:hypothetical protein
MPPDALEAIHAALDATRRAGTAIVRHPTQPEGPTGPLPYGLDGFADLARCRVALGSGALVWDGERSYRERDGEWVAAPTERAFTAFESHPLWMLLDGVRWTDPHDLGPGQVDGHPVRRLGARVEPPRRSVRRRRANAELWVGEDGLVRLASIQIQPVVITADKDLGRAAERLVGTAENPIWHTTVLSRFGVEVDIPDPPGTARSRRFARDRRTAR